jgi:hypothetical protein
MLFAGMMEGFRNTTVKQPVVRLGKISVKHHAAYKRLAVIDGTVTG